MRRELGRQGEEIAAQHLQRKGYQILVRNFQTRYGELDIIAIKNGVLVFVEVKTRRSDRFGSAEEAITHQKIEHIKKVALHYLSTHSVKHQEIRFDVITVRMADDSSHLNHIEAAF